MRFMRVAAGSFVAILASTTLTPWQVQGQSYCHVATVDYVKALATGAVKPGIVITTADDAPVTPR